MKPVRMVVVLLALAVATGAAPMAQKVAQRPGTLLEELTWKEAEAVLTPDAVVVIPIGAQAKEHGPHLKLRNDFTTAEYLKRRILERSAVIVAPTVPVALQVLRIGDVCLGTMPCEVLCEIGLDFKKRSPIQPALLVSLAHDYMGYLPTPRHFPLGGYETWLGTSRLEPQASEKMLDALLQMAAEVKD